MSVCSDFQNGLIKIMGLETTAGTHLWRRGNYVGHVKRPRQLFHKGRFNPFIEGWVGLRLNTGKSPRHGQILHSSFHVDFQSPFKALNSRTNNLVEKAFVFPVFSVVVNFIGMSLRSYYMILAWFWTFVLLRCLLVVIFQWQ